MLLTDQDAGLAALTAAFGDGWVFTVDAGRWLADPPPRFVPIWGERPFEAANPIALAAEVAEVQTCQEISDMQEETRGWEAGEREAGREANERSWAAVLAPGSFMNPTGTRPPTVSPDPSGHGRIWHLT